MQEIILQNNKPWVNKITPENLPNEDLKMVALLLGLEAAIKLMCEIPGVNISIPKNATLPAKVLYIMEKYDGTKKSRLKLAQECDLSEGYIYRIARKRSINQNPTK